MMKTFAIGTAAAVLLGTAALADGYGHRHRYQHGYAAPSDYCGYSPCVRIAEPPPVYRASVLWWPGYYDYAAGHWAHGRPRYLGYPRHAGYHGD